MYTHNYTSCVDLQYQSFVIALVVVLVTCTADTLIAGFKLYNNTPLICIQQRQFYRAIFALLTELKAAGLVELSVWRLECHEIESYSDSD